VPEDTWFGSKKYTGIALFVVIIIALSIMFMGLLIMVVESAKNDYKMKVLEAELERLKKE
jgi:hypothetical protein